LCPGEQREGNWFVHAQLSKKGGWLVGLDFQAKTEAYMGATVQNMGSVMPQ